MPILAASVCTKGGKVLLSRQFAQMKRSRIESLLSVFPKLVSSNQQHTYVETESVRYVYQPMENLMVLLVTNLSSNIIEDLETLRLLSRLLRERCMPLDERTVSMNAMDIVFGFDEVISLGYRETVTLDQVISILEAKSQEEELHESNKKWQEARAHNLMIENAERIDKMKMEGGGFMTGISSSDPRRSGIGGGGGGKSSAGSSSSSGRKPFTGISSESLAAAAVSQGGSSASTKKPSVIPAGPRKGIALGKGKRDDTGSKLAQIAMEDQSVALPSQPSVTSTSSSSASAWGDSSQGGGSSSEPMGVRITFSEVISGVLDEEGSLLDATLQGSAILNVSNPQMTSIKVLMDTSKCPFQLKPHPFINRQLWESDQVLQPKQKKFSVGKGQELLRWKTTLKDHAEIFPLQFEVWKEVDDGDLVMRLDYKVTQPHITLDELVFRIPLNGTTTEVDAGVGLVTQEGDGSLLWRVQDLASQPEGTLDVSATLNSDAMEDPISVSFSSTTTLCRISVLEVYSLEDGNAVPYSQSFSYAAPPGNLVFAE